MRPHFHPVVISEKVQPLSSNTYKNLLKSVHDSIIIRIVYRRHCLYCVVALLPCLALHCWRNVGWYTFMFFSFLNHNFIISFLFAQAIFPSSFTRAQKNKKLIHFSCLHNHIHLVQNIRGRYLLSQDLMLMYQLLIYIFHLMHYIMT